jgi:hypothetical protein
MGKRKTLDEMRDIVESEGIGYAIQHYISHEDVAPEIADAWQRAASAMDDIEQALRLNGEDE